MNTDQIRKCNRIGIIFVLTIFCVIIGGMILLSFQEPTVPQISAHLYMTTDSKWVYPGQPINIDFHNLPNGSYRLIYPILNIFEWIENDTQKIGEINLILDREVETGKFYYIILERQSPWDNKFYIMDWLTIQFIEIEG
jgi:hypothetical protein